MILRVMRWLRHLSPDERRETIRAERELKEKMKEVDRTVADGEIHSEKIRSDFAKQIDESDGISTMLRDLMRDMDHQGHAR